MRLAALTAALVALALSAGAAAAASPGTLGAGLTPAPLNVDTTTSLVATDLSTLAETFTLTASDGYRVAPATFTLAPGASQTVAVVTIGSGPGTLTAHVAPAVPVGGAGVASALLLTTQLEHQGVPVDWRLPIVLVLAVLALFVVTAGTYMLHRPSPRPPCALHGYVHAPGDFCRG